MTESPQSTALRAVTAASRPAVALTAAVTPDDPSAPPRPAMVPARPMGVPPEIGGPVGLEPTRYGDWEKGGRCIDF